MSFLTVAPQQVEAAARDLADIRSLVEEAASSAARPTTGVLPAAADEISAAMSATFDKFGQDFQWLSAHAQTFHA
jgi:hypothetical protein